ncbi:ABC-type transport auxiliary lipoprotein family protein [Halomonas sp. YLGW01]|uniref:PqiC family protein n=1 Tax=Halomonas sp. YLGW01 TaxID=2773308 RepID=UPI001780D90B|nr:ABC-type transport auxiliary lipoprotein family protein [Halomonas sp. YLGW01]
MPLLRTLALVAILAWLGGCATQAAPTRHYSLPPDQTAPPEATKHQGADEHLLVVRPLALASFLEQPGIVLQLDDITLNPARDHLWAEDLGPMLERGLRRRLGRRLADTRVLAEANPAVPPRAMTLRLELERFQGRHDGQAMAAGQWQLRGADGQLLTLETFEVETALTSDGYPALVRALGESWDTLADRLASRIRALR